MLKIKIPSIELFDEKQNLFSHTKEYELQLEHSLVSISKWESKWKKPFLLKDKKTKEEMIDYVRCMTITQNIDHDVYNYLRDAELELINEYIEDPMSATTFNDNKKSKNKEIITSEIIYHWMIFFNIPSEYQKWHLNKLMALINVCNLKNQSSKKRSRKEILEERSRLNAERKAKLNSNG